MKSIRKSAIRRWPDDNSNFRRRITQGGTQINYDTAKMF